MTALGLEIDSRQSVRHERKKMADSQYEEQVRKNLRRMETAEIEERIQNGSFTEEAYQIAIDELELRNNKGNDEIPQSMSNASKVDSVQQFQNQRKYAVIFALGGVLVLAFLFGLLRQRPGLEDIVAANLGQLIIILPIILIVIFANSGFNWYRQKKGKPLRSLKEDAGTIMVVISISVISVSLFFILFS